MTIKMKQCNANLWESDYHYANNITQSWVFGKKKYANGEFIYIATGACNTREELEKKYDLELINYQEPSLPTVRACLCVGNNGAQLLVRPGDDVFVGATPNNKQLVKAIFVGASRDITKIKANWKRENCSESSKRIEILSFAEEHLDGKTAVMYLIDSNSIYAWAYNNKLLHSHLFTEEMRYHDYYHYDLMGVLK